MTTPIVLNAKPRTVVGKKVKKLRQAGILPAHVFGARIDPINLELDNREFAGIYRDVGETTVIQLRIKGEEKPRPVLVVGVQRDPLRADLTHVDFHQVTMTEEVEVEVPLKIEEGTAPAVRDRKGILLTQLDKITIKTLPGNIPEEIVVDLSGLTEIGDAIYVKELKLPEELQLLTDPEQVVVAIEPVVSEKMEAEAEEEAELKAEAEAAAEETPLTEETAVDQEAETGKSEATEAKPDQR